MPLGCASSWAHLDHNADRRQKSAGNPQRSLASVIVDRQFTITALAAVALFPRVGGSRRAGSGISCLSSVMLRRWNDRTLLEVEYV